MEPPALGAPRSLTWASFRAAWRGGAAMAADLEMHGFTSGWRPVFRLTEPTVRFQLLLRRAEALAALPAGGRPMRVLAGLSRLRARRAGLRLGLEIPFGVFGPGLSIAHPGLLVVNAAASVGARCRISHGVTIGVADGGAPEIGDDVFIGPNALVLGPIKVGDGAIIFPGAVVVHDVPAGHAALGVPATTRPHTRSPWRAGVEFGPR